MLSSLALANCAHFLPLNQTTLVSSSTGSAGDMHESKNNELMMLPTAYTIVGLICCEVFSKVWTRGFQVEQSQWGWISLWEHRTLIWADRLAWSGSTPGHNILKLLVIWVNPEDIVSAYVWKVDPLSQHKYSVLKCHKCTKILENWNWTT